MGGLFELVCRLWKGLTFAHRVFVSYRRDGGADRAELIARELNHWGRRFRTFVDVKSLRGGRWDDQLKRAIEEARGLIVVLTPGSLNPRLGEDVMQKEFEYAEQLNRRIVPVFDENFQKPAMSFGWVDRLLANQGVRWHHETVDHCVEQLARYLS